MAKNKRPIEVNQKAKSIVDIATGETKDPFLTQDGKNTAAVALGKLGGLKGGKARAAKLTSKRRKEIAKKAANKRWNKN